MENRMDIQGEIQSITNLGVYSIRSNVLLSFIPYLCIFYSYFRNSMRLSLFVTVGLFG